MNHDAMVASILDHYTKATDANIIAGGSWYADALSVCRELAGTYSVTIETAIAVVANLSPRTRWSFNIAYAAHCLSGDQFRPAGCLGMNWTKAQAAFVADDPESTVKGAKTKAFFANIAGDDQRVTVDAWALRVAGLFTSDELLAFDRKGGYQAVEAAYQDAAGQVGISPAAMQAITWCEIRGGAE